MKDQQSLIVRPSTKQDREKIETLISTEGFYAEYNEEFNEFNFPEENLDSLENILRMLFDENNINASFSSE